ncbi:MAG TPA: carboxypeptidase-like regulatory domain-containing protein [Candidatus Acidoferrales bacterium]|nr:carboxypeptidase-like regulatory domain-containing protein [Candidatus Acidoferrales bacterium]
MQSWTHQKRLKHVFAWAFLITLALCRAGAGRAQSSDSSSSNSQDHQGSTDKNGGKSAEPATTKLKIRVTSDTDKPIANASVYVRFYESGGFLHKDKLAEMNFKTNQDGSVKIPEIPQGKILIQVIASGWHTYGKWYDVDKDEEAITIKLVPPPHWY